MILDIILVWLTHTNPPQYAIYIWMNLPLFPLESDGRAAYMEIHPNLHYHTQPWEPAQYVCSPS
jgi:hypothetical protein